VWLLARHLSCVRNIIRVVPVSGITAGSMVSAETDNSEVSTDGGGSTGFVGFGRTRPSSHLPNRDLDTTGGLPSTAAA